MLLMIDNYDSFVFNLVRYIEELGEEVVIYRNDKISIEEIKDLEIDGIIISPGPKSPMEAGISLDILHNFKGIKPILGICLGHQCIGHYFGSKVVKGKEPVHGKISYINHKGTDLFEGIKNPLRVTRYHSLIIDNDNLSENIEVTSYTEDDTIMGIRHKEYPIFGLQFHPEAEMTEDGHNLLKNFIDITKSFKEDKND